MAANLFEQLDAGDRELVASLIGASDTPGFRLFLIATPALPAGFELRDAARAYLRTAMDCLDGKISLV